MLELAAESKLLNINVYTDAVGIQSSNRQRVPLFKVEPGRASPQGIPSTVRFTFAELPGESAGIGEPEAWLLLERG